ncbi:MAG: response regulator transcription factor [Ignavibacteriales bacterium]|nr:response regulator transcription factor [Ignavibacteriales bacterium]
MHQKSKITVIVADDHMIVRRGIVSLLSLNNEIEVVGEAVNGRSAVEQTMSLEPDVVIMDISMPELNGLEATRQIKSRIPRTKVLILSAYDNADFVGQVLQCGANGYLLKNTSPEDLYAAIRAVNSGHAFFSPAISKIILDGFLQRKNPEAAPETDPLNAKPFRGLLTPREREILQLVAEGKTHQQISSTLHISVRTVDTHRNNIMRKLDLHDAAALITYAIKQGVVILPP